MKRRFFLVIHQVITSRISLTKYPLTLFKLPVVKFPTPYGQFRPHKILILYSMGQLFHHFIAIYKRKGFPFLNCTVLWLCQYFHRILSAGKKWNSNSQIIISKRIPIKSWQTQLFLPVSHCHSYHHHCWVITVIILASLLSSLVITLITLIKVIKVITLIKVMMILSGLPLSPQAISLASRWTLSWKLSHWLPMMKMLMLSWWYS